MLATLDTGPLDVCCRLLLAHGAGAPMDSPFLETVAAMLATNGIAVTRFEFPYMAARRDGGKKRPAPKAESLVRDYASAIDFVLRRSKPGTRLFIGGKSMGGRVASLMAGDAYARQDIAGLVCFGYPFHPPAKPAQLRTAHLMTLACPTLIVQGIRDPLGSQAEVEALPLPPAIRFHWAPDGDHDLRPRGRSGFTQRHNLEAAADAVAAFVRG